MAAKEEIWFAVSCIIILQAAVLGGSPLFKYSVVSRWNNQVAENANDGDMESCWESGFHQQPYWAMKLPAPVNITTLEITGCMFGRVVVMVGDELHTDSSEARNGAICSEFFVPVENVGRPQKYDVACKLTLTGSVLVVTSSSDDYKRMQLCDVKYE